jgi:F-type H+-transporting ATPase subunit delta
MSLHQVAQRYARALFSLATEAKKVDAVRQDMLALSQFVAGSNELGTFIQAKRFGRSAQMDVFKGLLKTLKAGPQVQGFLAFVCAQGRIGLVQEMAQAFEVLAGESQGEIQVSLTTASPLGKTQEAGIKSALEKALSKKVIIDQTVDAQLLGGMRIRAGSMLIDGSLKTKLNQLHHVMREG